MENKEKDEIKVGDIVKFNKDIFIDIEKKKNLFGHIGLVIDPIIYLGWKRKAFPVKYGKEKCNIMSIEPSDLERLSEEQVANINLEDYFLAEDLEKYRGGRHEEETIKHIGDPALFEGKTLLDKAIEEEIERLSKKRKEERQKPTDALSYQVGGSHYKDKAIQPIVYIQANNLTFLEGSVVKRITRHREKQGALDIAKARQELDLILELEYHTTFDEVMKIRAPKTRRCFRRGKKGGSDGQI